MNDLISTQKAMELLGVENHARFRATSKSLPGFPAPVVKRNGHRPNMYSRAEIIEYGKTHRINNEINSYLSQYVQARKNGTSTCTPRPIDSMEIQFLRGEFSRIDQQVAKLQRIKRARMSQPKTIRISIGDRAA